MNTFAILVSAVFLCVLGVCFLFFARRIQRLAVAAQDRGWGSAFFDKFIRSNSYLWNVRFVGALAMLMASLLVWSWIRSL